MSEEVYEAEYIGPEPELQGHTFLVKPLATSNEAVQVQANDMKLIYRRTHLGQGWHCMPKVHLRRKGE